jgi:SulP family sulfate permease
MARVSTLDATGAQVLGDAIEKLENRGIVVLISGISDDHSEVLDRLGAAGHLREGGRIFDDTPAAIRYARNIALADPIPA